MNKIERKELLKRSKAQRLVRANASKTKQLWFDEKPEDFYLRCHADLTSQSYGIRIQEYIRSKAGLKNVSASKDQGDYENNNGVFIENKINYKSVDGKYLFLQIRPWQRVGHFFITIDPDNDYVAEYFYLTFEQMHSELRQLGTYCHGTKKSIKNERRMYSIRFDEGSEAHTRWLAKYKLTSYEAAITKLKTVKRKYVFLNTELNKLAPTILFGKKGKNNLTNER